MAGDWIKLETTTPDKPEVFIIADELGLDADAVLGKLCRIWIWADQQTVAGNAGSVTKALPPALLDRIAGATGFASAMLSVGWLVETEHGLSFPNFERHNGQTAKSRALTAKRVARSRENVTEAKRRCNARTVTESLPEKRREEKREKVATPNGVACADRQSAPPNGSPSGTGYIFATKSGAWELPARKLAEYEACYQFDVAASLRKAVQWCRDNPAKRKSPGGMAAFLTKWLNREHDRIGTPPANGRPTNEEATARLRQRMERMAMERQQQGAAQ